MEITIHAGEYEQQPRSYHLRVASSSAEFSRLVYALRRLAQQQFVGPFRHPGSRRQRTNSCENGRRLHITATSITCRGAGAAPAPMRAVGRDVRVLDGGHSSRGAVPHPRALLACARCSRAWYPHSRRSHESRRGQRGGCPTTARRRARVVGQARCRARVVGQTTRGAGGGRASTSQRWPGGPSFGSSSSAATASRRTTTCGRAGRFRGRSSARRASGARRASCLGRMATSTARCLADRGRMCSQAGHPQAGCRQRSSWRSRATQPCPHRRAAARGGSAWRSGRPRRRRGG